MTMLRYKIDGESGKPLLLIHGWGVTYTVWQNLAPLLKPHFQLIMIELPGIGGSPDVDQIEPYYPACAEAIEKVRQNLGIQQWSILAYSSGTRAAEAYAQRYPQYITHAVFLCPIYTTVWWALGLHLLENNRHHLALTNWIFSDWRLYSLVLALGFNGRSRYHSREWKQEIELQPLESLVRSLCELPGKGRVPFALPAIPTLFVWGRHDALTIHPRRLRPNDIVIPATHSAPMLAASRVAEVVTPFLLEGKVIAKRADRRYSKYRSKFDRNVRRTGQRTRLLGFLRRKGQRPFKGRRPTILLI